VPPGLVVPIALLAILSVIAIPQPSLSQVQEVGDGPAVAEPEQVAGDAGGTTESEMVLIPGGEFLMGKEGYADFSPPHEVRIAPFFIDRFEVTNAQYLEFCKATDRRLPEFWGLDVYRSGPDYPEYPVIGVSWLDARDYARWRGARLPTEAEWEYAARGGLVNKNYSHGDDFDSTLYAPGGFTGSAAPIRVGSFPPNGFGLHDMTRNVCEWVSDWYDEDYYSMSPADNPTGPGRGSFKGVRSGGWHTGPYCSRVYFRTALKSNWVDFNVGFRCAQYEGASAALEMERTITELGIAMALAEYRAMRGSQPGTYYFDESEFNEMGYRLIGKEKIAEAIEVFELTAEAFPQSFNAYDSLGEAYMIHGDSESAIRNYRRALELNRACRTSRAALQKLTEE
jgi:formylglycine-generating enzyme required for sulfatase activity